MVKILGVRIGHDSSACLVVDGKIIADSSEERFTRIKNDGTLPIRAIEYCLRAGALKMEEIDIVAIPSVDPSPEFDRFSYRSTVRTSPQRNPVGIRGRAKRILSLSETEAPPALPLYFTPFRLKEDCAIVLVEHHLAHAASAYYTSGFNNRKCLIVTMDGRGDGVSVAVWRGLNGRIEPIVKMGGESSIGWFFSAVTEALGWRHGSDEWKTMGLAPYGKPKPGALDGFHPVFKNGALLKAHEYGAATRWHDHGVNHYHLHDSESLRKIVDNLGRETVAAEAQRVVEEQAFEVILPWLEKEGTRSLCCAGGVFLNVKMNQRIWYSGRVDEQWIFPNPGDAGLAAGAALYAYAQERPEWTGERLKTMYFGPEFSDQEIIDLLKERKIDYEYNEDIASVAARYLANNKIVAWFQGRMESGPRALGSRSILMSPLRAEHKDLINACVKYREAFRPFCPSILHERRADYLQNAREERFMITSFDVVPTITARIPAVVHVDNTVRPQTVRREDNPLYHDLIQAFGDLTGEYVILNTSLNIKGEPIVCTPREALRCFFDTGLDILIMGHCLIRKPVLSADG